MASRQDPSLGGELTPKTAAILNFSYALKTQADNEKTRADAEKLREEQALLRLRQQQQPPPLSFAYGGPMPPPPVFGHLQQQSLGNFPSSGQQLGAPPSSTQSTGAGGAQLDQSTGAEIQDNAASGRQPTVAEDQAPSNLWPRPQLHDQYAQLFPGDQWGFHVTDATHTVTARSLYSGAPAIMLGPTRRRSAAGVMRLLVRKSDGTFTVFHTSKFESRA